MKTAGFHGPETSSVQKVYYSHTLLEHDECAFWITDDILREQGTIEVEEQ